MDANLCNTPLAEYPGMSGVFWESVDTLPRGYYIHRLASTDNLRMSRVSGESMEGHWTTDGVLGQPSISVNL